jgi:glycosyltransferase involved in cell wall biosynthesis
MDTGPTTILYVTDAPTVSGAEHVLLSYLDRLGPPAFRTHVFLRASNRRLVDELVRRGTPYTTSRRFSERIVRTTLRPGDLAHFAGSFRAVRRELIALCARLRPDVLHTISYPAAIYTALAARAVLRPHIWHEHNVKRIHAFNRWIYRSTASTCSFVVGPSKAVTGALARAGIASPRLQTVYNGIDLDRFRPDPDGGARVRRELGLDPGQPAIGLVGQLLPYKGHATLIEAAPEVLRRHARARFFIVGSLENPPYEASLRAQIHAAGLGPAFTFTGWRRDIPAVVAALNVLTVPTLTPEPAALGLMEAMASGRPLVASRTGGTPELVADGETGRLVTPGRPDELARAIVDLLDDPEQARRMGGAGRRVMETRFSQEQHLDQMRDLYRRSCEGGPGRPTAVVRPGKGDRRAIGGPDREIGTAPRRET